MAGNKICKNKSFQQRNRKLFKRRNGSNHRDVDATKQQGMITEEQYEYYYSVIEKQEDGTYYLISYGSPIWSIEMRLSNNERRHVTREWGRNPGHIYIYRFKGKLPYIINGQY